MQWLIIKSSSLEAEGAEYALLGKNQQQDNFSQSGWTQLKALSRGKRIILLIPTEDVVLNSINIPATNQKQLTKAVPFALEDRLAEDIDTLHFVHHRQSADKDVNISAINKQLLQQWLDKLSTFGLAPHFILPDVFALPVDDDSAALTINHDQQRALYRKNTFSGFATDVALLPTLLPSVLNESNTQHLLLDNPSTELDSSFDITALDIPESIHIQATPGINRSCSASLLQALPLNLLNQFVAAGRSNVMKSLSQWKSVAALAALIGVLWMATTAIQNYRLKQQLTNLNQSIASVYEKTFPNTPVNDDYRVLHSIMDEKLKSLNKGQAPKAESPLELLVSISPKIKKHKDIKISTLRFDSTGLNMAITAPSLTGLENFRAAVDSGNIDAEVISSTSSANKVESTLLIKKEKP